ncbi:MAG TPA: methyltransferase [Candidatus Dormibacteraeota bacterium]|nr:methyltransferase [Candidatus Dormibacteraeota bacterium]
MDKTAQDRAFELVGGFRSTQMVRAVIQLKIPDLVATGPRSSDDLAASTGVQAEPLRRILRCLVSVGVFIETEDGRFGSTPVSDCFRDQPGSLRGMALLLPEETYVAFGDLMHTLKTGEPAFEHVFRMSRWEQLAQDPEKAALFNAGMQSRTERVRDDVASAYDWAALPSIIDVGGGRGTLIAGLLKAHPHVRGTVFDLDAGLAEADGYLKGQGVRDRCEIVRGSFFESVPAGHDAYVLKNIVHDWNDEKACAILASCRKAMGADARLILIEQVMQAHAENSADAQRLFMLDVQMLVVLGGQERTEAEYGTLMQMAGLRLTRVLPVDSIYQLIEGVPA